MKTYQLIIAYDGTHYGGWQVQPNAISIQELIQEALSTILRQPMYVIASGRTDAGVHALAQSAHFRYPHPLELPKLHLSLNALLPLDIRIMEIKEVSPAFHARFSAESKIYHYHLHLDPVIDPFQRLYTYRVPHRVDLELLAQATRYFVGEHDFTSFANKPEATANKNCVRHISRIDCVPTTGGVYLAFEGNGFLYKMVRNIVGTLLDVCAHRLAVSDIANIMAKKDRRASGRAAPPHGLFLIEVNYPDQLLSNNTSNDEMCSAPKRTHSSTCSL